MRVKSYFYVKLILKKKAQNLNQAECKKIIYFSKLVLKKAIRLGGSSIRDFKNVSGKDGLFQNEFKVYQREHLKCLKYNCRGKIEKKIISKRSTFFCNKCQNQTIILLTTLNSQAIPLRLWQIQNRRLKELEEFQDRL